MTVGEASHRVYSGCTICGGAREAFRAVDFDHRCSSCGSLACDRIMHAVLAVEMRNEVISPTARALLLGLDDCQASLVLSFAEQYLCAEAESPDADLIADPAELTSLPNDCFDVVVASGRLSGRSDLDKVLSEARRILLPGGHLLWPGPMRTKPEVRSRRALPAVEGRRLLNRLQRHFVVRTVTGVDPVARASGPIHLGCKDAPPLGPQPEASPELRGYAYHLSRLTGRRIVFCLDGPLSEGDRLPVVSATGDTVGHATIGPYSGGRTTPSEPWKDGFQLPPRCTYELDPAAPSGVYALDGQIPFVHRSQAPASIAVLVPSNTATAFNDAGGRNLYATPERPSADVLSFHRPMHPELLLERCWPFVEWFATANPCPWDTTYLVDSDLEEDDALDGVEVLVVIGRSEYWTRKMREQFDAHVDRGGRVLLLCSELMFWQVRVNDALHQLHRYKEDDPHPDPLLRTIEWHRPSLQYPVYPRTGCELWYGGFGTLKNGPGWGGMRIVSPESPLLADTDLLTGDIVQLPDASVWDGAPVTQDSDGTPKVDFADSPPWRHEVVGYNLVEPIVDELPRGQLATSLWLVLRQTPETGTVIHCGTMGWCGPCAVGQRNRNSDRVRAIILRMLSVLLENEWPFSFGPDAA